jgi:hypothetical protein
MMPWNPSPLIEEGWLSADERPAEFEPPQSNVHWFHGAMLVGPDFESREGGAGLAWRFLCHLLIDCIADEGIPEVCQSLREFYDYYRPSETMQGYLPEVCEREATRGEQLIRPSFTVEGE